MLMNKKGFSMLEMLICMCIISILMLFSISNTNKLNLEHYDFMNNYILLQSKAILNKQEEQIGKGLYFNSMGHINQAKTIDFNNRSIIIHLGNGYATIK